MIPVELVRASPDGWDRLKALVLDSVSSLHSRRAYAKALEDFRLWGIRAGEPGFSRAAVQAHRDLIAGETLAVALEAREAETGTDGTAVGSGSSVTIEVERA